MPILDPVQHGAHRSDFGLADGSGSLNVDDDIVIGVDQKIG